MIKILKNNKGLSLIEIMVGLGLVGILTAIAVPQFAAYQRDVKYGVLRSIITIPYRTFEIEASLGRGVSSLTEGYLWSRVKSKDKTHFDTTFSANNNAWCFMIEGKTTGDYEGFDACINQLGTVRIGGDNVPCNQAKGSITDNDGGSPQVNCVVTACPGNCQAKGGTNPTTCTDFVTGDTTYTAQPFDCEPGPQGEVYTLGLGCAGGACTP